MGPYPHSGEISYEAVRSRGPGGQNVNRTNSAAILRWHLPSTKLPERVRLRLLEKLGSQLTGEGELLVRCEESRDQDANKKTCWTKLCAIIDKALFIPKKRIKTKPGKSAIRKRLNEKKHQGAKKQDRGRGNWD